MLDNKLIEASLALMGKTMEDMNEIIGTDFDELICEFSIEKFCYYLLSPEFIEKYKSNVPMAMEKPNWVSYIVGYAIYEYQSGNESPLIELLSKIGAKSY